MEEKIIIFQVDNRQIGVLSPRPFINLRDSDSSAAFGGIGSPDRFRYHIKRLRSRRTLHEARFDQFARLSPLEEEAMRTRAALSEFVKRNCFRPGSEATDGEIGAHFRRMLR